MSRVIEVVNDAEAVSLAAAKRVVMAAQQAIAERGSFSIALSGGSTPKRLYQHLASNVFCDQIEWSKVRIFFGDERTVAPDHADANFRMASEAMLDQLPIPASQIHRMQGELADLEQAAASYAEALQLLPQKSGFPEFDLVLLGMGDDGHTASLFPGTTALSERDKSVVALEVPQLNTCRITLSYPVINNARQVMLLVAGAGKAEQLEQVLVSAPVGSFPVQEVTPQGELIWLLDEGAAAQLPKAMLA